MAVFNTVRASQVTFYIKVVSEVILSMFTMITSTWLNLTELDERSVCERNSWKSLSISNAFKESARSEDVTLIPK